MNDQKNSLNSYLWIWCLLNTIGLVSLLMCLGITKEINYNETQAVHDMEIRLNEMEALKADTIIVNINNYITK